MRRITAATVLLCAFFITPAEARHRQQQVVSLGECSRYEGRCDSSYSAPLAQERVRVAHHSAPRPQKYARRVERRQIASASLEGTGIVSHPDGCPWRAFCGCGAAVRIFGSPVRDLWLAANWFKFSRAAPAPGMVAVRRHHVFVLEAQLERGLWLVYDANSGRHLTRIHARSLAGYTIVNPHSG